MKRLLAISVVALLGGCSDAILYGTNAAGEVRYPHVRQEEQRQQVNRIVAHYTAECQRLGVDISNNDKLASCIKQLYYRDNASRPTSPSYIDDFARGLGAAGNILLAPSTAPPTRNTDYRCMSDCRKRYSWDYCEKICSY